DRRHAVHRIEALVGVGRLGEVAVAGDLPAREVDRLQPRLDHLDGLAAGDRAERLDVRLGVEQAPELLGALTGERVLDLDGAAEADDLVRSVAALNARPALIGLPLALQALAASAADLGRGHVAPFGRGLRIR